MLAIAGGKGGCGKTTTALGLARGFAAAGERPLVVDADCDMPNLHTMADTDPTPGLGALEAGASLDRAIHRSRRCPGVDILPAGSATGPLDTATCRRLRRSRGRLLVDCPAGATDGVAGPVRAADHVLVVSTPASPSQVDAAKTARMARALDTPVAGGVVTRVDPETDRPADAPLGETVEVLATVPELDADAVPGVTDPVGRSSYERIVERLRSRNI